jgi:pimeloyl-ACP methyl ester carboxylesterase
MNCPLPVLVLAAAASFTAGCSCSVYVDLANAATRIEEARFVTLGGIEQWITIRGDEERNPILVLVHGGPGDVQSPFVETYAPYERDFVLVQWDQRGAGKTYAKYGDATPELTLNRVARDGIELAEYLRSRWPDNDILLLGHSWGTAIATQMVLERPDLFAAYVGTGQIASWAESVNWQFDFLMAKARETGNDELLAKLTAMGRPDPTDIAQFLAIAQPLRQYLDDSDAEWLAGVVELARSSPFVTETDFEALGNGMLYSGRTLFATQTLERLSSTALRFALPYYVIQGRHDLFTPTPPAAAYFAQVVAPKKEMIVLEDAGHFALATHAEELIRALQGLTR